MIMENKLVQALRSFLGFDKDMSEEDKTTVELIEEEYGIKAKKEESNKRLDFPVYTLTKKPAALENMGPFLSGKDKRRKRRMMEREKRKSNRRIRNLGCDPVEI